MPKITAQLITNLKTKEAQREVDTAIDKAMKNVVTDIAGDAIKGSPFLTGNNRRSIAYEVGPGKEVAQQKNEGAVYGTSGYSGYLEIGSKIMPARPYFRPALDKNLPKLPAGIKAELR